MRQKKYHKTLGSYFQSKPHYLDEPIQKKPNIRKLVEQPWQQTNGEMWDEVTDTLCNLDFIESKCMANIVFDLIEDYSEAIYNLPECMEIRKKELDYQECVREWIDKIIAYSKSWNLHRDLSYSLWGVEDFPTLQESINLFQRLTSDEVAEAKKEELIDPDRKNRLISFNKFVTSQCYLISDICFTSGSIIQHALNFSPEGPVCLAAYNILTKNKLSYLQKNWGDNISLSPESPLLLTIKGHEGSVNCLDILPAGNIAISGSSDNTLKKWDLNSGKCLHTFAGYNSAVTCLSTTPDGKFVISGSVDKTLLLWELRNSEPIAKLIANDEEIRCVRITPDGHFAISGSKDGTLILWDLTNGSTKYTFIHKHVSSVTISANGCFAISSGENDIRIWDLGTGTLKHLFNNVANLGIETMDMSLDGRYLIIASGTFYSQNTIIQIWDLEKNFYKKEIAVPAYKDWPIKIFCLGISPDGSIISAGCNDGKILVWNIDSGECICDLDGHSDRVISLSQSADNCRIISGDSNGTMKVWNIENRSSVEKPEQHDRGVANICITTDGKNAITSGFDENIKIWDIESTACLKTLEGQNGTMNLLTLLPDDEHFISGSSVLYNGDTCIRLWDIGSEKNVYKFSGHEDHLNSLSVTPDGRHIISSSRDKTIRVWQIDSGECIQTINMNTSDFEIAAVMNDSNRIVVLLGNDYNTNDHKIIQVWNLEKEECIQNIEKDPVNAFQYIKTAKDGRLAVSYTDIQDGSAIYCLLNIWDIEKNKSTPLKRIYINRPILNCLLTPDGNRVISISQDKISVYDIKTGSCLNEFSYVFNKYSGAVIPPIGNYLILWGQKNNSIFSYDLENGSCLGSYFCGFPVKKIAISGKNNIICVGTSQGEVFFLKIIKNDGLSSYEINNYERILLNGLEFSRKVKGTYHKETIAHLQALAFHYVFLKEHEKAKKYLDDWTKCLFRN
jgi:WD40 repeat protein